MFNNIIIKKLFLSPSLSLRQRDKSRHACHTVHSQSLSKAYVFSPWLARRSKSSSDGRRKSSFSHFLLMRRSLLLILVLSVNEISPTGDSFFSKGPKKSSSAERGKDSLRWPPPLRSETKQRGVWRSRPGPRPHSRRQQRASSAVRRDCLNATQINSSVEYRIEKDDY